MNQALIIFVRNPIMGQVKTRLAKTAGAEKALEIYKRLLEYTNRISKNLNCDRFVFYADEIAEVDLWNNEYYGKVLQSGEDLGARMNNAFGLLFEKGYQHICIIGSDCGELTSAHIEEAFAGLQQHDVVIGPSSDGGYYLLAISRLLPGLFEDIKWSTPQVLEQTLERCTTEGLRYELLATLNDIDTEEDWINFQSTL